MLVARSNYVKRTPLADFGSQTRGGRGRAGLSKDATVAHLVTCHDHDTLLCVGDGGVVHGVRAFHVPQASRIARGVPVPSVLPVDASVRLAGLLAVENGALAADDAYLVVLTEKGLVKKTPLSAFADLTSRGLIAAKLGDGDRVGWAKLCTDADDLVVVSRGGQIARFAADSFRASGRTSRGVKTIKLRAGDAIAKMDVLTPDATHVIVATARGVGKRVARDDISVKGRVGAGVAALKFKEAGDAVVACAACGDDDEVMLVTEKGVMVRQAARGIAAQSRTARGVQLQAVGDGDALIDVSVVPSDLAAQPEGP